MLVVVMIIVGLMSLAVGAFTGLLEPNLTVSLRGLLASEVRQARQLSLTTGQPVILSIDRAQGQISGQSMRPVLIEDFDFDFPILDFFDGDPTEAPQFLPMGQAGYAWQSSPNHPAWRLQQLTDGDERPFQLTPADGWLLSCDLLPLPMKLTTDSLSVMPLLLVTPPQATDDVSTPGPAIAGLELWRQPLFTKRPLLPEDSAYDPNECTYVWRRSQGYHWMLVGWIGDRPSYPLTASDDEQTLDNWISTVERLDFVRDYHIPPEDQDEAIYAGVLANPHAELGGVWQQIGLLFDGHALHLLRNGARIDTVDIDGSKPAFSNYRSEIESLGRSSIALWVGRHSLGAQTFDAAAHFDSIECLRLAASEPTELPSGLRPVDDYRIRAIAGTIECLQGSDQTYASTEQLDFIDASSDRRLSCTVSTTGAITLNEETTP